MNNKDNLQDEKELIYLLLHSKDAIDRFYNLGVVPESFSEEYIPIVKAILEAYNVDGVLLTRKSFKEQLKFSKIPKERISQELTFNYCYSAKASMDDLPLLVNKIIEQNVKISITKSLDTFTTNSVSKGDIYAIKQLAGDCEDILSSSVVSKEKSYYADIRELSKERIKYIEDVRSGLIKEKPLILSGIREIDYTMATGFEDGILTLIVADVSGYKSTMLLNIGLNVWKNDFNVLFVPLEMNKNQMWRRACARESRIDSRLLTRKVKDLSEDNMEKIRKMDKEWDSYSSMFYMMDSPGNTTVTNIQRQIEKNIEIFSPKLVVIDYIANLEADKNRYGRNDLEIGDMLKSLRRSGKDLGFAVLSAAQLGREALKRIRKTGSNKEKTSINSEDIRGSHEYSADADNIYAQLKSTSQPNELLDLYCVKSRNGPTTFEDGNIRATLDIRPEFGLISSPPQYGACGDPDDSEEDGNYKADLEDLMDKAETDKVIEGNTMFVEDDDIYNYDSDFYNNTNNSDIENSIEDEELSKSEWNSDW